MTSQPEKSGDITAERYERLDIIGRGSFGDVYRGWDSQQQKDVAIKVIDLEDVEDDIEDIHKEVAVLAQCKSKNITEYFASVLKPGSTELLIIMELMATSVYDLLQDAPLDEPTIAWVVKETLQALAYLHSENRIHRDIKAANILLSKDGEVKISDFGVSGQLTGTLGFRRRTFVGTPYWMAPEVIESSEEGYTETADIWSIGITAIEMSCGSPPHADLHPMRVLFLIPKEPPPKLEGQFSAAFKDFVDVCLQKEAARRPSAAQLLEHEFLQGLEQPPMLRELIEKHCAARRHAAGHQARLAQMDHLQQNTLPKWDLPEMETGTLRAVPPARPPKPAGTLKSHPYGTLKQQPASGTTRLSTAGSSSALEDDFGSSSEPHKESSSSAGSGEFAARGEAAGGGSGARSGVASPGTRSGTASPGDRPSSGARSPELEEQEEDAGVGRGDVERPGVAPARMEEVGEADDEGPLGPSSVGKQEDGLLPDPRRRSSSGGLGVSPQRGAEEVALNSHEAEQLTTPHTSGTVRYSDAGTVRTRPEQSGALPGRSRPQSAPPARLKAVGSPADPGPITSKSAASAASPVPEPEVLSKLLRPAMLAAVGADRSAGNAAAQALQALATLESSAPGALQSMLSEALRLLSNSGGEGSQMQPILSAAEGLFGGEARLKQQAALPDLGPLGNFLLSRWRENVAQARMNNPRFMD